MKKLFKKKMNLFGKEFSVLVVGLFAMALVSASLISYFGTITGDVTINQGLKLDDKAWDDTSITYSNTLTSLESKTISSGKHTLSNSAGVDATITLDKVCSAIGDGCDDIDSITEYVLSSTGSVGSSNEERIRINAEDVGINTLDDLDNMSWDVDGSGYIAHVDVLIDTTGDGIKDDALVFEYAKVKSPFDNTPYPTGKFDTFGDKGIIDGTSYAWLTTEDSGPVGGAGYTAYTLTDWKLGKTSNKASKVIPSNVAVIGFEIETDNWIMDSESDVSNIKINGVEVSKITILSGDTLDFEIVTDFPKMMKPDTYTITTTVNDA